MARTSSPCPECPKFVEIKFSTGRLLTHLTPEGENCPGSGSWPVPVLSAAPKKQKPKARAADPQEAVGEMIARLTPEAPKKRREPKGGSVWTVSGGLPGLGRRR